MAARLTDKQKKKIVADYVNIGSYNAVGKMNGVSDTTVKRICTECGDLQKKIEEKKADNTADILEYLENQKKQVCQIIGIGLKVLCDEKKMSEATPSQITTAIGTLIDKFSAISINTHNTENNMQTLADLINAPLPNRNIADFEDIADE